MYDVTEAIVNGIIITTTVIDLITILIDVLHFILTSF